MESLKFSVAAKENVLLFCIFALEDENLTLLKRKALEAIAEFCQDYVWQRDAFRLIASEESWPDWLEQDTERGFDQVKSFLWGSMRYGDAVDEEWFVVSLLKKITERLPSLAIQVWDNDGEFLLIECAYVLPKWIQPTTSQNRVWLREGKLHIVPREYPSRDEILPLALNQALAVLKSNVRTEAKDDIQSKILKRLGSFPQDTTRTQHWARCLLPVRLAQILRRSPFLISAVIDSFLERESGGMSLVQFTPLDFTTFHPPKRYPLPDISHPSYKSAQLGMKITCGAELLYQKQSAQNSTNEAAAVQMQLAKEDEISVDEFRHLYPVFAEDDDSWLTENEKELEKAITKLEKEMNATSESARPYDGNDLVHSFTAFVDNVSSHEGAEVPKDIRLDPRRFLAELKDALGDDFAELNVSDSNSASELDDNTFLDDSSDASVSVTDSDDESDFGAAYDAAMQSELMTSEMDKSFVKRTAAAENLPSGEVDVDVNLVESLLESHAAGSGMLGPAENLAVLLDTTLPSQKH